MPVHRWVPSACWWLASWLCTACVSWWSVLTTSATGESVPCTSRVTDCPSRFRYQRWKWALNTHHSRLSVLAEGGCWLTAFLWKFLCPFLACCHLSHGLPGWLSGKESTCHWSRHRRRGFDPWVRKIPWRRAWQPIPVFWPGKYHGQKSLAGSSPWRPKESDMTVWLSTHTPSVTLTYNQCTETICSFMCFVICTPLKRFYHMIA